MGWYTKGFDEADEQIAAFSGGFTKEFFIKGDEEAPVYFLDDEPFNIRDHWVKGKGSFTCIQGVGEENCPLCEAGNSAGNHFVFNVLDPREYTDKKGGKHQNEVKIFRVGVTLFRVLRKKSVRYGPLSQLDITISKLGSGKSVSYDVEVEKREGPIKLPEGQEPYNLEETLAPKSRQELLNILNNVSSGVSTFDADDDDDQEIDWKKS
jgi:hypothetical protein